MPTQINGTTGVSANALPFLVGQVNFFATSSAPAGFLKCSGQAVSRTTYAALFTAIGTLYGVGDGSTTFNLPDLRGEFLRGLDDGRGVDAGRAVGSSQLAGAKQYAAAMSNSAVGGTRTREINTPAWTATHALGSGTLSNAQSITKGVELIALNDDENRPRNVALLACIFTGVNQ